jgi:hypothetical protein
MPLGLHKAINGPAVRGLQPAALNIVYLSPIASGGTTLSMKLSSSATLSIWNKRLWLHTRLRAVISVAVAEFQAAALSARVDGFPENSPRLLLPVSGSMNAVTSNPRTLTTATVRIPPSATRAVLTGQASSNRVNRFAPLQKLAHKGGYEMMPSPRSPRGGANAIAN